MAKEIQHICDGCGKKLTELDRNRRTRRVSCLEIKGQIIEQHIDKETGWHSHTFITDSKTDNLSFCLDTWQDCLTEYIQRKKNRWESIKRDRLMQEATENRLNRLMKREDGDTDYGKKIGQFVIGQK